MDAVRSQTGVDGTNTFPYINSVNLLSGDPPLVFIAVILELGFGKKKKKKKMLYFLLQLAASACHSYF